MCHRSSINCDYPSAIYCVDYSVNVICCRMNHKNRIILIFFEMWKVSCINRRMKSYRPSDNVLVGVRIWDSFSKKSSLNERALRVNLLVPRKLCCLLPNPAGLWPLCDGDGQCSPASAKNTQSKSEEKKCVGLKTCQITVNERDPINSHIFLKS